MAKEVIMYFVVGAIMGALGMFIGYDKIAPMIKGSAYARKGYYNHLNLYPYRPASLY